MAWASQKELVDELGLVADSSNKEAILKVIQTELATIHPDRTGGVFASDEVKQRFHRLREAEDWLRSRDALVPISQVHEMITAMATALQPNKEIQLSHLRGECRDDERRALHTRYFFPKIGSAVFAAITGALFLFEGTLEKHPMLSKIFKDSIIAQQFLLMLSIMGAFLFVVLWFQERREEAQVEWLMSESGRSRTFQEFTELHREHTQTTTFTLHDLAEFLQFRHRRPGFRHLPWPYSRLLNQQRISDPVVEKLATLYVNELESRGVIKRLKQPSLDLTFEIDTRAIGSDHPRTQT